MASLVVDTAVAATSMDVYARSRSPLPSSNNPSADAPPGDLGPGYSTDTSGLPSYSTYAPDSVTGFANGPGSGVSPGYSSATYGSRSAPALPFGGFRAGGAVRRPNPVILPGAYAVGAFPGGVRANSFAVSSAGAAGAAQSINTNVMAINAYRHVAEASQILSSSLEKLSSGKRINTASDDASGLAMAENLRSQVLGNRQALRNAQDGISLAQTAEGVLGSVHDMLQRMRQLAVQGANGSNSLPNRAAIAHEIDSIRLEIGRIGEATEIMGKRILGDKYVEPADALRFQIGANATELDTIGITFVDLVDIARAQLGQVPQDADHAAFQKAIKGIDEQIGVISQARGSLGSVMNRFEHTISSLNVTVENLSEAQSRLEDCDFAAESSTFMRGKILAQSSQAMLSHATLAPRGVLTLLSVA